jgi:hypothetical protein
MALLRKLWFWVVLAFVVLIGAWGTLIMIAVKNKPAAVPSAEVSDGD